MNTKTVPAPTFRLWLMMVLEFAIWGAWVPLIFGYLPSLGFEAWQQSLILNAFPIAAIVGMFFSNQFADRTFSAEKFLGFSHVVGGLAMLGCGFTRSFWPFFLLMLLHCLLYVPTISITNSIAFAAMKDARREFGIVRMGGTIGWILASLPFTFIFIDWAQVHAKMPADAGFVEWIGTVLANPLTGDVLKEATRWTFIVSGIISLALAAYSLTLPHTPPRKNAGDGGLAWLEAFKVLRHPFVLVLWLVTFVDAFIHNCYFNWTGTFLEATRESGGVGIPGNWIMPVMSIGQVAEILTMFILGATLKALGWRITLMIGILGHALRFAVYAFLPQYPWLIVAVQIVHGVCYAFYFATVYIFVDAYFPKDIRASAHGLFNLQILGIGALAANSVCPLLMECAAGKASPDSALGTWLQTTLFTLPQGGGSDYRSLFLIPTIAAIIATVALAVAFWPPRSVGTADAEAAH